MTALLALLVLLAMPAGPKRQPATTTDLIARRRLYPVREAAALLGMHRTTVYSRHREGLIEILRIGGRAYVSADEIERFITQAEPTRSAVGS